MQREQVDGGGFWATEVYHLANKSKKAGIIVVRRLEVVGRLNVLKGLNGHVRTTWK
jgi:hypothetical protein